MKKIILSFLLLSLANPAYSLDDDANKTSNRNLISVKQLAKKFPCPENYTGQNSCISKDLLADSSIVVDEINLNNQYSIVKVIEEFAYQAGGPIFLKSNDQYYPLLDIITPTIDKHNLILRTDSLDRGIGDIGSSKFYKIDLENKKLILQKQFSTSLKDGDSDQPDYINEQGKAAQESDFSDRADNYAKKMHWNFE